MPDSQCELCRFYNADIGFCSCPDDILGLECLLIEMLLDTSPEISFDSEFC